MVRNVNPALLNPLINVLSTAYWFRGDLRDFLTVATGERGLVAQYPWHDKTVSKRDISRSLVQELAADQHKHRDTLIRLLLAAADMPDPVSLKRQEDGLTKYTVAVEAIDTLRPLVSPYRREQEELDLLHRRLETERAVNALRQHTNDVLEDLRKEFAEAHKLDPQPRGYALERILNRLFDVYELDARAPFRLAGEQIDGAFSLNGTDFIVEAKWQAKPMTTDDLTIFGAKIARRLDNTLGLFLSMSGYQASVVDHVARAGRHMTLLMDGSDLMAVLEQRIPLDELLVRKKRHAAETGNVLFTAWQILAT